MRKMATVFIGFTLFNLILFGGEVSAASDKATAGAASVDNEPDELQKQYLERLKKINYRLTNEHLTSVKNARLDMIQTKLELLKLRSLGRIPLDVKMQRQELKDEEIRTEANIRNLDEQKENLKLDVLKFYSGEMPKWLSEKWQEEENNHKNYISKMYKEVNEEMREKYEKLKEEYNVR